MRDTDYLTSLSIDGEYISDTCSELRGWLLRASATLLEWVLQEPHKGLSPLDFDLPPALASTVAAL